MRNDRYKQVIVVQENNAIDFQNSLNDALAGLVDPEIIIEHNIPFCAYIFFTISKDVPETVLELFEMIDGEYHTCQECPYFTRDDDRRKKRGSCSLKNYTPRFDELVCESFYLWRIRELKEVEEAYKQIPYKSV